MGEQATESAEDRFLRTLHNICKTVPKPVGEGLMLLYEDARRETRNNAASLAHQFISTRLIRAMSAETTLNLAQEIALAIRSGGLNA